MEQVMSFVVNKTRNSFFLIFLILAGCGGTEESVPPSKPVEQATPAIEPVTPEPVQESRETASFIPATLSIDAIDVKAKSEIVGKDKQGRMDVPKKTEQVAWYRYGAEANQTGNVILAGHLDDTDGPAVFYDLAKMKPGQKIELQSKTGQTLSYVVTNVTSYPVDEAPVGSIFGATVAKRLTLISCIGTFTKSKGYDERLVVTADQIEE
ncbi:class F sortase [Exiguobacterium oxidotolerans]|uniref:class F sortase n=1 Tax=Exiguobacterium oxidotolerans TaxID=223958 RepID=UPI000A50BD87|nr:class F sortase [Exiguobacterium oxidotolerans]